MCTTHIHVCFKVNYIFISLSSYFLLFVSINIELGHETENFKITTTDIQVNHIKLEKRNKIDIDINLKLISKSK